MASKRKSTVAPAVRTSDSFQNFMAAVGHGTGNQHDGSHYGFHPISRNRVQMEWAYRGSWIVGRMVDIIAQDMTREGVTILSNDDPGKLKEFDKELARLQIWDELCQTIKWNRLYGGSLAFMMIDGQDASTPLRIETIGQGQFKGLLALDRWLVNPSLHQLVTSYGPRYGNPEFYQTVPDTMGMPLLRIHHSRVLRFEGVRLPYWQRIAENLWGQSVLERLWDRLLAFDSTTTGAAQLVYKAHLRTYSVEDLREIVSSGGAAYQGLVQQIAMMRFTQTNEGITLMDAKDKYEAHQYSFSGLDALLMQFGEQLAGATEIPLVRLFGQSPSGFSTGETDLQAYEDSIKQRQVSALAPAGLEDLYKVAYASFFGKSTPKEFTLEFKPLRQMTDAERAETANKNTATVTEAYEKQIVRRATALRELKQQSDITGIWTNIEDAEIEEAEDDPPPTPEALGLEVPEKPQPMLPGAKGEKEEPKKVEYKPDDARPFKALDAEGVPRHEETGRFTHGMGLSEKRFDEKGELDDDGEWAESPLGRVKTKSMREAIQAAHPRTCKAYGALGEIEPWKCQGTQSVVNIRKVGDYRRDHGEPITVVKRNGEHGIVDGHHRAVAALLQNRNVEANVVDMDRAFSEAEDAEAQHPGLGVLGSLHLATELRLKNTPTRPKTKDSLLRRLLRWLDDEASFNPNEPRVPKGQPGGGQWTKGGANPSTTKKISGQLGSNEGGVYEINGQKSYVKFPKYVDQARTEVLASDVALAMNLWTHNPQLKTVEGKTAVVSPWKDLSKVNWSQPGAVKKLSPNQRTDLATMYYAAVLSKNWDVLGVDYSNIQMMPNGQLVQIDTGGSFKFRAQGKSKDYGSDINELESLMNPSIPSGKVFSELKKVDPSAFIAAFDRVKQMNVFSLAEKFKSSGLPDASKLYETFVERRSKLLTKGPPKLSSEIDPTDEFSSIQEKSKPKVSHAEISKLLDPAKPKLKKGDPGYKTVHQRLRDVMKASHEASGWQASQLVASVIKVPPPPVTSENSKVLQAYVGSSSALNHSLRGNKGDLSKVDPHYRKQAEVLDRMMQEARDYAVTIQVTRGIPSHVISSLNEGDTFIDHGYQSSSFSRQISGAFGSHTHLEIRLPKGFKFLSVPSYTKAKGGGGTAMNEAEAILPRGTALKIRKIATESGKKVYYVDAMSSAIQPPTTEWKSTKAAKLKKPEPPNAPVV